MYVATLESNYDIKQTRLMKVPAEVVFKNINNFNKWGNWSPWYELDSTIVASSEVNSGVGASYIWAGKDGNVSVKTISLIPNKEIIQQFDLDSESTSEMYWNLTEFEGATEVDSSRVELISDITPKVLSYTIVNTYPHDVKAYTEGLEFYRDTLYEGTGNGAGNTSGIRGISSLIGGNDPLIVVDGVQGNMDLLNQIPPSEIASIDILKDASATAIYGSRGAPGVIIVSTKKNKAGKINFTLLNEILNLMRCKNIIFIKINSSNVII